MSTEFRCGDESQLAGYLYDECDAAERRGVEAHLAVCPRCAEEIAALRDARIALASWTPPDAELGFRIVSEPRVLRPARWWQQPLPAWAQVAAALLIFTAGALVGVGRSTSQAAAPQTAVVQRSAAVTPATVSQRDLTALEQRLRRELMPTRTGAAEPAVRVAASDEQLIQRMRQLVSESEQRQERELAFRLSQVMRDVDAQRRVDLARIERSVGQMEGITGAEVADQRRVINYLMRVSQRPQ